VTKSPVPPRELPVRTHVVCAYVYRKAGKDIRFLVMKRKSPYMYGLWAQVAGKVEQGESAIVAILREIKEETGLVPHSLYSTDFAETFYDFAHDCIHIVPVFAAEVSAKDRVVLSDEHSEYKWVSSIQAKRLVSFFQQKNSIDIIEKEFARNKPPEELLIKL